MKRDVWNYCTAPKDKSTTILGRVSDVVLPWSNFTSLERHSSKESTFSQDFAISQNKKYIKNI